MCYTEQDILKMAEAASVDMASFYKQGFINYRGSTKDTNEFYTEVVARWCCENLEKFEEISTISRGKSYQIDGHDGIPPNEYSNREVELIAMAMKRQGEIPPLGKIIDYQTPLKNNRSDNAGKIDLLAYDCSILRILELKEPNSKETMLRCVLESYTYLKTVDVKKLLKDFNLPLCTETVACLLLFSDSAQHKETLEDRPWLARLMKYLNTKSYYVSKIDGRFVVRE